MNNQNNLFDYEDWQEQNKKNLQKTGDKKAYNANQHFGFIFLWKQYEAACTPQLNDLILAQFPELENPHLSFKPILYKVVEHSIYEFIEFMHAILIWSNDGLHPNDKCPKLLEFGKTHEVHRRHEMRTPDNPPEWMKSFPPPQWDKLCREENEENQKADAYLINIYNGYINVMHDEIERMENIGNNKTKLIK
ncbi:MAG: hypothetical protein ABI855_09625 [Bacteroidota bacterium]